MGGRGSYPRPFILKLKGSPMVKMIAQREIHYAQKTYQAGEELEMADQDAYLLGLLEHVKAAPTSSAKKVETPKQAAVVSEDNTYRTAVVTPEEPPMTTEKSEPIVPPRKKDKLPAPKKYKRRDMRAGR